MNSLFSIPPIVALVGAGAKTWPTSPRGSETRPSANGRSDERLVTPLAFYPGFPAGVTASALAHANLDAAAEN